MGSGVASKEYIILEPALQGLRAPPGTCSVMTTTHTQKSAKTQISSISEEFLDPNSLSVTGITPIENTSNHMGREQTLWIPSYWPWGNITNRLEQFEEPDSNTNATSQDFANLTETVTA